MAGRMWVVQMINREFLAKKHAGMKVSCDGLLGRIVDGRERANKGNRYILGCMLDHLKEMADRFYSGDVTAVDEFFQLYCLDRKRPSED